MEFPVYETRPADAPPALLAALGIEAIRNSVYNEETKILLLEITMWFFVQRKVSRV